MTKLRLLVAKNFLRRQARFIDGEE
jgi:hypothetical protein